MASDFQRPRSWIKFWSTLAQSSAVAPPACRERASSSSGLMPRFAGPSAARLRRRAALMSVGVTCLVTES
jgi:hypothetical protein